MKKYILYSLLIFVGFSLFSCQNKKAPQDQALHPYNPNVQYLFTAQDTATVLSLVNQFISCMEQRDVRSAVELLSFLDGDSIKPLNPMFKRRQAMSLSACLGVSYKIDRLVFETDKKNEVKMDIILFEKPEGDIRPNKTSFYFRPVRFEGQWYLTTKDNITDTNSHERNETSEQ